MQIGGLELDHENIFKIFKNILLHHNMPKKILSFMCSI
jgi:hypothetical protein